MVSMLLKKESGIDVDISTFQHISGKLFPLKSVIFGPMTVWNACSCLVLLKVSTY